VAPRKLASRLVGSKGAFVPQSVGQWYQCRANRLLLQQVLQLHSFAPTMLSTFLMHTAHLASFPRFQKALDSAKQGEDMWVLLESANIHDAKLKKVSSSRACARRIRSAHQFCLVPGIVL
jgi:hypothetical protein